MKYRLDNSGLINFSQKDMISFAPQSKDHLADIVKLSPC